jgi:hypothetical protein
MVSHQQPSQQPLVHLITGTEHDDLVTGLGRQT